MQVKDIINIINSFDVKVIFDRPEEVVYKIMNGGSPLYFTPVEGKEREKFKNLKNNQEFISTSAAIHIIDLSVKDFINIFECDGTGVHQFTKNMIKPYCNKGIQEDIIYVIYLFLHEVGHWTQFEKMNRNVVQFISKDFNLTENNSDKMHALKNQNHITSDNKCDLIARKKRLLGQYMQEYRNIPKEKEADEFALREIEKVLKTCKSSLLRL